jgi:histidine ammonia-lyase
VSMAPWAGRKLLEICTNTSTVLGIELLAAARAIDSMRPLRTTPVLEKVHALVRSHAPSQAHDHRLDRGISALTTLVQSGTLTGFLR